ncbi:MAG: ribosome biogenesis GTPase YlqF [Oscillospiraceae bacterium]|nr:ribosome biogenesis GTPase YlqF [Oscillospiraceae bacterium]
MDIQWYPGHMTKTRRMISDNLKMVDAVCEVLDARIPISSRNYDIFELSKEKPRLIILNRVDLADAEKTKKWAEFYRSCGYHVLETNSKNGSGVSAFPSAIKQLLSEKLESYRQKGQIGRSVRVMICGVPNVGKSSFINRVSGRNIAKAEDRPGVTRDKQWIKVDGGIDLLDTPGMLWPKFDDKRTALNLAFTGAIKDEILDVESLASLLMEVLSERYPESLEDRYKISSDSEEPGYEILERAGKKRGFLISGGEVNTERMAKTLLDEFRAGMLGRITLENTDEADRAPLEKIEFRGMLSE